MALFTPYLDLTDFDDSMVIMPSSFLIDGANVSGRKSGEATTTHQQQTEQTNDGEAEEEVSVAECLLGLSSHTESLLAAQPKSKEATVPSALASTSAAKPNHHKRCNVDGCTNFSRKGGVCATHQPPPDAAASSSEQLKQKNRGHKKCSVEGCTTFSRKGGVCLKHAAFARVVVVEQLKKKRSHHKKCSVEGCTKYGQKGGVCVKHGAPSAAGAAANAAPDDDDRSGSIISRPTLSPGMESRYPFNTEISKPQPRRMDPVIDMAAAVVAAFATTAVTKPILSTTACPPGRGMMAFYAKPTLSTTASDGPSQKKPRIASSTATSKMGTRPSFSSKPAAATTLIQHKLLLNNNKKQPPQASSSSKLATSKLAPNNASSIPSKGNNMEGEASSSSPPAAATDYATEYLKAWMNHPNHIHHPYPNNEQRITIMNDTGLTIQQLAMWFVNYRETYWKKPTDGDNNDDNDKVENDKGADNDVSVVAQNEKKPDNNGGEISVCHNEPLVSVPNPLVPNPLIAQQPSDNKKKDGMVSDSDNESIIKEQQAMIDCNQKKMPSQQQAWQSTDFEFALTEEDLIDCNQKKMPPQQALQSTSDNESIKEQQATIDCNQKKMPSQQQAWQSMDFEFALTEEDFASSENDDCSLSSAQKQQLLYFQQQQHAASTSSFTSICYYPEYSNEVAYNKQDASWWKKFYDLEAFKKEHGHVDVKQKWEKDPSLGVWVNTQRTFMHRSEKDIANGTPIEKIKRYWRVPLLKGIGLKCTIGKGTCGERPDRLVSAANLYLWDSRFADLVKYKEAHGNCEVKLLDPQYKSLGRWVGNQRKQFRETYQNEEQHKKSSNKEHHPVLHKKTTTGEKKLMAIDLERYQKLKDIGFKFVLRRKPTSDQDVGSAVEEEKKKKKSVPTIRDGKALHLTALRQRLGQQQSKPTYDEKIIALCSGLKANDDVANNKKCVQQEDGASSSVEKKAPIVEPNKTPTSEVKPPAEKTSSFDGTTVSDGPFPKKKPWYESAYAMVNSGEKKAAVVRTEAMNKNSQQPSNNESSSSPKGESSCFSNIMPSDPGENNRSVPNPITHDC